MFILTLTVRCGDFGAIGFLWINRDPIPTTQRFLDVGLLKIRETISSQKQELQ